MDKFPNIFRILQHFALKLCNITYFGMLFHAIVMNCTISNFSKILSIMQLVHSIVYSWFIFNSEKLVLSVSQLFRPVLVFGIAEYILIVIVLYAVRQQSNHTPFHFCLSPQVWVCSLDYPRKVRRLDLLQGVPKNPQKSLKYIIEFERIWMP